MLDAQVANASSADKFRVERCPATVAEVFAGIERPSIWSTVQVVSEKQRDVFINSKILMLSLDGF